MKNNVSLSMWIVKNVDLLIHVIFDPHHLYSTFSICGRLTTDH